MVHDPEYSTLFQESSTLGDARVAGIDQWISSYSSAVVFAENLVAFLLLEDLPNDLRFSLHRDLITISEEIANMLRDPKLAKLVIAGL